MASTPADGMLAGLGTVNADRFPAAGNGSAASANVAVCAYDYTVLAGTQGMWNHFKKDRLFDVAKRLRLPVLFYTEGGGGRPGDTDGINYAGLNCTAFAQWAQLSGLVPLVGIASGYCFAGNAVILGCCDVIIATTDACVGLGGPAMIEGGGLGTFHPSEVGPVAQSVPNGTVDILVADEAEATAVAKRYLSYFQGAYDPRSAAGWGTCADQRRVLN